MLAQAHAIAQQSVDPMNYMRATCLNEAVQILVFDVVVDILLLPQHVRRYVVAWLSVLRVFKLTHASSSLGVSP